MRGKKLMTMVMAIILAFAMTACGNGSEELKQRVDVDVSMDVESSEMDELPEDEGMYEAQSEEEEEPTQTVEIEVDKFKTTATMEPTVLYEENDVKITATGLNYSNYYVELTVNVENNSTKNLTFLSGTLGYSANAINGIMTDDGYLNLDVSAGKKANDTIKFKINELQLFGISEIAEIQLSIEVQDDDYNRFYTGPMKISTSIADKYDFAKNSFATVMQNGVFEYLAKSTIEYYTAVDMYDQEGIQIVSQGLVTNDAGERILMYEVVNNSEQFVYFNSANLAINDLKIYGYTCGDKSINPGARRVVALVLSNYLENEYAELYGVADIAQVSIDCKLKDIIFQDLTKQKGVTFVFEETMPPLNMDGVEVYNDDNIRIISKGLYESPSEYNEDVHLLLTFENKTSEKLALSIEYDSVSVNEYMIDYYTYDASKTDAGKCSVLKLEIDEDSLTDNAIEGIDAITNVEFELKVRNEAYKELELPIIKVEF